MTTIPARVLQLSDSGAPPDAIAAALSVSTGYVYGILRRERPDRPRKARTRDSALRAKIVGLAGCGIARTRIVALLENECSKAYVYRILSEK